MSKSTFRPQPRPSPSYPDLEQFDEQRRGFLQQLGAVVLGAALLAPLDAQAAPPKKKRGKKKDGEDDGGKPQPPRPGGKGPAPSRQDQIEDDLWAATGEAPRGKKDRKKAAKKKEPKKPRPPLLGDPVQPESRLDRQLDGCDD